MSPTCVLDCAYNWTASYCAVPCRWHSTAPPSLQSIPNYSVHITPGHCQPSPLHCMYPLERGRYPPDRNLQTTRQKQVKPVFCLLLFLSSQNKISAFLAMRVSAGILKIRTKFCPARSTLPGSVRHCRDCRSLGGRLWQGLA